MSKLTEIGKPMRSISKTQQPGSQIVLAGSRRRTAPPGAGTVTKKTVYTLCPSAAYDARVQCAPDEQIEGGFLAEWQRLRK